MQSFNLTSGRGFLRGKILSFICCPICHSDLDLTMTQEMDDEIIAGGLRCTKCECVYPVIGGIPILTPPETKPYDWFSTEMANAFKRYEPREAIRMMGDGEIGPKRLSPGESMLTSQEMLEGDYKDSENYLWERFGSIESAREHFNRRHREVRKIFETMIDKGRLDEARILLDLGTGYGYFLQFLTERFKDIDLFGVDISYTNLKAVRGRFRVFDIGQNVQFVAADAHRLPFFSGTFDVVEAYAGSGNIVGFCNIMGQAHRVLRDDGWFVSDIGGLEDADQDVKPIIDLVGHDFLIKNARKIGLMPTGVEVVDHMSELGFSEISSVIVDSKQIISGRK